MLKAEGKHTGGKLKCRKLPVTALAVNPWKAPFGWINLSRFDVRAEDQRLAPPWRLRR
jgi:hypothetical protein